MEAAVRQLVAAMQQEQQEQQQQHQQQVNIKDFSISRELRDDIVIGSLLGGDGDPGCAQASWRQPAGTSQPARSSQPASASH